MVDVPREPEAEPTAVEKVVAKADSWLRIALAGDEVGAIRRIALYLVVAVGLWGAADAWVFSLTALVALVLLMVTDRLV